MSLVPLSRFFGHHMFYLLKHSLRKAKKIKNCFSFVFFLISAVAFYRIWFFFSFLPKSSSSSSPAKKQKTIIFQSLSKVASSFSQKKKIHFANWKYWFFLINMLLLAKRNGFVFFFTRIVQPYFFLSSLS